VGQGPLGDLGRAPAVPGPGSRVAGYLLEQQIGAGGMAVVYRARDVRLDRLVALKVMAPAMAGDETFRLRFVREARAAAAVDDPHIIPVYEAGDTGGVLFIAMRFVGGGDVRSLLCREGPLSPDRGMSVIAPVASALDAAHAAGLVHRDVKPANMLLDTGPGRPDHVYLSDFGLSKGMQSGGLTGSGQFLGTPDYAAPEQIEGAGADGRTDQYALACSAFELLTGKVPFARSEGWATVWAHLNTPPPALTALRPELPRAADVVLARAMAKSPQDRYPTCREFAAALRAALGTGPYPPTKPGTSAAAKTGRSTAAPSTGGPFPAGPATVTVAGHRASLGHGTADSRQAVRSRRRRRRIITLAAAVLACAAAIAALAVPRLTGTGAPSAGAGRTADPPLFSLIAAFTPPRVPGRWQEVTSVAFSPNGKALAVGLTTGRGDMADARTFGGETYLYDTATGRPSAVLAAEGGTAAFSPDGKLLAASGGTGQHLVYLASATAGTTGAAMPGTSDVPIRNVAFSPDGRLIAANDSAGGIYLWSTATRRPVPTAISESAPNTALAFSPDGRTIAVAEIGDIWLCKVAGGTLTAMLPLSQNAIVSSVAYSPDGKLIAATMPDFGIGLWDAATHKRIGRLQDPGGLGVDAVAFSPDSQLLAAGDENGKTYLWDLRTRKLTATLADPIGPVPPGLAGQGIYAVRSAAFSPDGRTLATSDTDGSAYTWRVR
jgi:DNA-binding beta-propeller fold protein YncE